MGQPSGSPLVGVRNRLLTVGHGVDGFLSAVDCLVDCVSDALGRLGDLVEWVLGIGSCRAGAWAGEQGGRVLRECARLVTVWGPTQNLGRHTRRQSP